MLSIDISINKQQLTLKKGTTILETFPISSAKNGVGNKNNSGCTPLGLHQIKIKIGANLPINSVFIGRRPTGEIYSPQLAQEFKNRDWILSRILWLQGMEIGINRGQGIDSLKRFIYIHGTPDSEPMKIPLSCGCIRMRNHDIIKLFDLTPTKTLVNIKL